MEGLFAGTPPLEALRYLIHEAATVRTNEKVGSKVLMVSDVLKAFFEAPATRNVCVEIPKKEKTEADVRHDKVGCGHELGGGGREGDEKAGVP